MGQSVPWEVRTGPAARCAESCWQCVPRAPSSNPLTYRLHLQQSGTRQQRCRGRAKRETSKDPQLTRAALAVELLTIFVFFNFPSSFAQFSKMNRSICCCLIREKTGLFSGSLSCMPRTEGCVISCIRHASCGPPASAGLGCSLQPRLQLPSCPPTQVGRLSPDTPPSVLPGAVLSRGQPSVSHTPRKTGERVCAQRTYVEPGPPLTAHL